MGFALLQMPHNANAESRIDANGRTQCRHCRAPVCLILACLFIFGLVVVVVFRRLVYFLCDFLTRLFFLSNSGFAFFSGMSCYRSRKSGERKRKSVRGCIVSSEMSIVNLVVVKKGEQDIEGLTNDQKPRRLGPKRATRIRKLFGLTKADDVRKFVIRREIEKNGKKSTKAPKIQRLVTPARLQVCFPIRFESRFVTCPSPARGTLHVAHHRLLFFLF